jgi:lipopolysaccharide transport system permease protein
MSVNQTVTPENKVSFYHTMEFTPTGWRGMRGGLWRRILHNLMESRDIILLLMWRDISLRSRQSFLGTVWVVVMPLSAVVLLTFLVSRRVLPVGDTGLPYVLFALINISIWQAVSAVLIGATNSLLLAGPLVTRINFAKEALVFAALGQPLMDFAIRLVLITGAFIWYGINPGWTSLPALILVIPLMLLALGAGFFLAVLNLVIRDTSNALGVIMSFGLFLAPILYPPPSQWPFVLVNFLNPISPLLIGIQSLLVHGSLQNPGMVVGTILFSVLVFFMGWRFFVLILPRIAERA